MRAKRDEGNAVIDEMHFKFLAEWLSCEQAERDEWRKEQLKHQFGEDDAFKSFLNQCIHYCDEIIDSIEEDMNGYKSASRIHEGDGKGFQIKGDGAEDSAQLDADIQQEGVGAKGEGSPVCGCSPEPRKICTCYSDGVGHKQCKCPDGAVLIGDGRPLDNGKNVLQPDESGQQAAVGGRVQPGSGHPEQMAAIQEDDGRAEVDSDLWGWEDI